jgi:hypothetical protein
MADTTYEISWPESMSAEQREALKPLLAAFDTAASKLAQDTAAVIFPSEEERKRLFFGSLARWGKAWSKPGLCMYDGCTRKSIARSHSISLGASIVQIAEDGHVLTPKYGNDGIEMVRIGKREASTFPGFCDEHEALFAEFENQGAITEDRHFQLQVFRSLCREIYSKRHGQQKLNDMLAVYRPLRDDYMRRAIVPNHPKDEDGASSFNVRFENDPTEGQMVDLLASSKEDLVELESLYHLIVDDLRAGTTNVAIQVRAFDLQLPVCLSGLGVLNYREDGTEKRCLACLAVLPEAQGTKILLAVAPEHEAVAALHLSETASPAVLARVESWMLHGSDHWFIRPSSWALFPEVRQRAIRERIPVPGSLIEEPPFSVLDDARQQIIAEIARALASGELSAEDEARARQLLTEEQGKLDYDPG